MTGVREATAADAPAVESLVYGIADELFGGTLPPLADSVAQWIDDPNYWLFVAAEADGKLAGYCVLHRVPFLLIGGYEGYVTELFLRSGVRGGGIGAKLLDMAVETARAEGFKRIRLINMKTRDSYKRGFYAKQGWRERTEAADFMLDL